MRPSAKQGFLLAVEFGARVVRPALEMARRSRPVSTEHKIAQVVELVDTQVSEIRIRF